MRAFLSFVSSMHLKTSVIRDLTYRFPTAQSETPYHRESAIMKAIVSRISLKIYRMPHMTSGYVIRPNRFSENIIIILDRQLIFLCFKR